MSAVSTKAAAATAAAQPAKTAFSVPAVPLLNNPAASAVAVAHPLLLAGLFAWRFNALVADPVAAMWTALPVVAAIQAVFAVVCLPVAGSQAAKALKKPRPGEKKKADGGPSALSTAVLSLVLTAIVTPLLHVLFVLFGAPFLTHVPHTLLACAHFALLAVFPVFYVRGVDAVAMQAVLGASAPLDSTFGGLAGAVVGAWLGAVPIPLDWDREWQKWPVTVVVGAYLGYVLGSRVLGTVWYGTRCATAPAPKEE